MDPVLCTKFEYRVADQLIPYERNARTDNSARIEQIIASTKMYLFTQPILIDGQWNTLPGHARLIPTRSVGLDVEFIGLATQSGGGK